MISLNENNAGGEMPLAEIEKLTSTFADDYNWLRAVAADIQQQQNDVIKAHLPTLRKAAAEAAAAREKLAAAVVENAALFADKKTHTSFGIKVGFRKGSGKMIIADEAAFLKKLETMFPDESARGIYLRVEVSPLKAALEELPAADLKKLGVTIEATGDVLVIKPVEGDVDKFVAALLKPDPE